jgi:N6-L-threonylcarbamoyladenine synthase
MTILGTTRDDAAGEAFDKIAKLMGLEYPGGPLIDALAREGNPKAFAFTRPKVPRLDMSFSGLKTQVLYFLQRELQKNPDFVDQYRADIAASVQFAILDILMDKLDSAVEQTGIRTVAIAGGVSANSGLRAALESRSNMTSGTAPGPSAPAPWTIHIPPMAYCTDNAAMIAIAGSLSFGLGKRGALDDVPNPRLAF